MKHASTMVRSPWLRNLVISTLLVGIAFFARSHWASNAGATAIRAASPDIVVSRATNTNSGTTSPDGVAVDDELPCYQYIIPPEDCTDGSGADTGGDGDPNDSDGSIGTVWPSSFGLIGSYNGHTIFGWATRQGTSSSYRFIGDDGLDCGIIGIINLSVGEAILIDLNIGTVLSSWSVTGADPGCD